VFNQNIDFIIKKSPTEFTEYFDTTSIKKNQILVPLKHSSSKIENIALFDSLKNEVIYSIELIYTESDKNAFNQEKLNRKRLSELNSIAPQFITNNLIEWSFIEQKKNIHYNSKNLFHGYLITLRPKLEGKNGLTEFQILERLIKEEKTPCNNSNTTDSITVSTDSINYQKIEHSNAEEPKFRGGEEEFKNYLKPKLIYSKSMFKDNVSGYLSVSFYINKKGEFSKVDFSDNLTDECRHLVKKTLKEMPQWLPGISRKGLIGGSFRISLFFSQESQQIYIQRLSYSGPYIEKSISDLLGDYYFPESILCDSTVFKALERNKHWKNISIVADLTGSMFPYTNQLILWFKLNIQDERIKSFTFFNDGDNTPDANKVIGKVGGIYQGKASNYNEILSLAEQTMRYSGQDIMENNIEAAIAAMNEYPNADELVMIADNYATPRDLKLLNKVKKPIRLILCGTYYGINVDYLNLVRKNGGSIHTMENDLTELIKMNEGEILNFNDRKFKIINSDFVEVYEL
jgi:hypothetical protein